MRKVRHRGIDEFILPRKDETGPEMSILGGFSELQRQRDSTIQTQSPTVKVIPKGYVTTNTYQVQHEEELLT